MKGIREIRRRIKAVKNTSQITRAMQLVAASKMKRAQNKAKKGRPYAFHLAEVLSALVQSLHRAGEEMTHPLLEEREIKTRGILLISTDKGPLWCIECKFISINRGEGKQASEICVCGAQGDAIPLTCRPRLNGRLYDKRPLYFFRGTRCC